MKTSVVLTILLCCFAMLSANYVKNQPFEQIQPDGSKLSLFVTGDEFYHRVHDARDFTILQHPETGYAVYAVPDGNSIKASDYLVGQIDPSTVGIPAGLTQDPALIQERVDTHRLGLENDENRSPTSGTLNNLFVFVRFADQSEYTGAISTYESMCNSTTSASMKGFFTEESGSQLTIGTTFYPAAVGGIIRSYQDSHNRGYFSPYSATNTIGYTSETQGNTRLHTMLKAAAVYVTPSIPADLNLDGDTDGYVDNICFVAQGSSDNWGDVLWPHRWDLLYVSAFYINTKRVYNYNFQLSNSIDTGVICHEMSHSLGFPDLYHYTDNGINPVGSWDLMEWDANVPQHHLAYMKWKYGNWFGTLPTIVPTPTATTYTVSAVNASPFSCYKIASNLENQFYMVEYRRKTGTYENSIPASGLIIYRVNTSASGNADGPPDEVYVYRPGGTISADGTINQANFSSTVGRNSINNTTNPKPWLYVNSITSLDGNLQISNIGATTGGTISFTVQNTSPNVWDGSTSTDWNTATNWSLNNVPVAEHYVEIPASMPRYPIISTSQACANLIISDGASVTISTGTLTVTLDVANSGTLAMNNSAGNLYVQRDLYFYSGSTANITAHAEIYVQSDVEFLAGSSVNMTFGYLEFYGTGSSYFRTYVATAINHFRSNKDATNISGISAVSSAALTINGSVWVYAGSTFTHPYTGTTVVKGNISCYTGGTISFASGTLSMEGTISSTISLVDSGNYLRNLTIAKTANTAYISANTTVNGNLTIQSGIFNLQSYTLTLGGNWINNAGVAAFSEGTSTVILNGTGTQNVSTETFNILELNKSANSMVIGAASVVSCASYNWTAGSYNVSGGTFNVADLVDPGIFGNITLASGTINYTQDAAQYADLRGTLSISDGGNFNIYGGSGSVWFSYIDAATLTMTSGTLDIKDQGIYLSAGNLFTDNISGGTIRTSKGFEVYGASFNPTGGTVELYGGIDSNLNCAAGSNFFNVTINKTTSREEQLRSEPEYRIERDGSTVPLTRSNMVFAYSNILITSSLTVTAGTFDVNSKTVTVNNDLNIYGTMKMVTAGSVDVADDVNWMASSSSNVTAGNIYCGGNWLFAIGCGANLSGSTSRLDSAYGASITNNSPTATFGNLEIYATEEDPETGFLCAAGCQLLVSGNLTVYATNTLNLNENNCTVSGNTYINATGIINVGDGGSLTINGGLDLQGSLVTGPGTCTVHGFFTTYTNGSLSVVGGQFTNDAAWNTGGSNVITLNGAVTVSSGTLEITGKSLVIQAHATRVFDNAILRVGAGFSATALNCYLPSGGSLYLIGTLSPTLDVSNSNYVNNLNIQKSISSATVWLQNTIQVSGTFNLVNGRFNANNYNMTVHGDWINSVGTSAFIPGTGTVTFESISVLTISGETNFYNVTQDWWGNTLDFTGMTGISGTFNVTHTVTMHAGATIGTVNNVSDSSLLALYSVVPYNIASYNGGGRLYCVYSHLTIADLVQDGIYGDIEVYGGSIEFHQDSASRIDLNGQIAIQNNSIVDIYGGSTDCYMAYASSCVFTLITSEFNIRNHGFNITNNGFYGDFNVTSGIMRIAGSWTDNWGIFDPSGGIVEMVGTTNETVTAHASSWFWTLVVNKIDARDSSDSSLESSEESSTTPITRAGNLNLGACNIQGGLTVQAANIVNQTGTVSVLNASAVTINSGIYTLNGNTLATTGNVLVYGILNLTSSSSLQIANTKTLTIYHGGKLLAVGTSTLPAMITRNTSGYYGLAVESGGTIGANFTIFEYMNATGLYLNPGAVVDEEYSLDYCTFRLGAAGGRLLWINNSQSFDVNGAVFPANTWGGACNVSKSVNNGIVYFDNWTGAFGGQTFEQDTYNHIYWEGFGVPPITDLDISYVPATNRVLLNWTYPLAATSYRIYRSLNPNDIFTYYATSTTNTWSQVVHGTEFFYRVTAITP